jgi:hypothetical protein
MKVIIFLAALVLEIFGKKPKQSSRIKKVINRPDLNGHMF